MTDQEIFDTVATHLFQQGKPAVDNNIAGPRCLYRGPGGTKCAFGILIEDEEYDPDMEERPSSEVIYVFPSLRRYSPYKALINDLQGVHDSNGISDLVWDDDKEPTAFVRDELRNALAEVATRYQLSPSILEQYR